MNAAQRKGASRPSLLQQVTLSDGRLAWPVASALGISEPTFRARLNLGQSPDAATFAPVLTRKAAARNAGRAPRQRYGRASALAALTLPDGRLALEIAAQVGVSAQTLRLRLYRGWTLHRAVSQPARGWRPASKHSAASRRVPRRARRV